MWIKFKKKYSKKFFFALSLLLSGIACIILGPFPLFQIEPNFYLVIVTVGFIGFSTSFIFATAIPELII